MVVFSLVLILLATYFAAQLGWLAILGIGILFIKPLSWRQFAYWSICLLAGHLWWVAVLAHKYMAASCMRVILLYIAMVLWVSLLSTIFWWVSWRVLHIVWPRLRVVLLLPLYFYLLAHCSTPFLSGIRGYPFANPVLPIITWWCEVWRHSGVSSMAESILCIKLRRTGFGIQIAGERSNRPHLKQLNIYLLAIPTKKSRAARAQQLMMSLNAIPAPPKKGVNLIVSPESTVTHELCKNAAEYDWWRGVLPENATWLFGATINENNQINQAAVFLTKSLITQKHIKHNCIDFFESCSKKSKVHRFLNKLIGWQTQDYCAASQQGGAITIQGVRIQVLLCAEALWAAKSDADIEIVLANETWFLPFVQELFFASLVWRQMLSGKPLLVVGHGRCFRIMHNMSG